MAIAITLPGFNDLGRSVTLIFLMMARFLFQTFTFSLKNEENVSIRSLIILQNASSNSVFLALRLSVRRFQMPVEGLNFVETLVTFAIIYATHPLLQKMTKIVFIC